MMKRLSRSIFGVWQSFIVRGALFLAPILITIFALDLILGLADGWIGPIINTILRWYLPGATGLHNPWVSLVVFLLFLTFLGMIASWRIGNHGLKLIDHIFLKIPVLRGIYSASRKVTDIINNETSFQKVVIVPWNGAQTMGFVTGSTKDKVTGKPGYTVIIPMSPNPLTGFIMFYSEDQVIDSGLTIQQGIETVASMGILVHDELPLSKSVPAETEKE